MDFFNEIMKSFGNNEPVYFVAGLLLFFIAIAIVRKLIDLAIFMVVAVCIFVFINGTISSNSLADLKNNPNFSFISGTVDSVKKAFNDSLNFIKNIDKTAGNAADNVLDETEKMDKELDKDKELEKVLKNF